jgi:hypothetical protein
LKTVFALFYFGGRAMGCDGVFNAPKPKASGSIPCVIHRNREEKSLKSKTWVIREK